MAITVQTKNIKTDAYIGTKKENNSIKKTKSTKKKK